MAVRITSPKAHWTMVGYTAAMRRMEIDAVLTGKKVDVYIRAGFKKGIKNRDKRDIAKIATDPEVMEMLADKVHDAVEEVTRHQDVLMIATLFQQPRSMLYRYWCSGPKKCVLYSNFYMKTHDYLLFLVTEARRVTPGVRDSEIEHNIINNSTHKGMMTCEWPSETCPKGYDVIEQLPQCF
jgi:hypothetical protein